MPERMEPWVTSAPALDSLTREVREIGSPEEWQEWRTHDFPSSMLGALFQAHTFVELTDVVARMQGREQRRETRAMRRGTIMEACFPAAIREVHPHWHIIKASTYHRLPELRLGATPDYWIVDEPEKHKRVLETKTMNERSWYEDNHGVPPLYWNLQVQGQLLCTGAESAVIAVMIPNADLPLYLFTVESHPAAQAKILGAVVDFWLRYDAGEFPVPVPKDEIAEMLDDGSHVDLSSDPKLPDWLEKREIMVANRTWAEKEIKGIDYEIKNRMGKASTAYVPGWEISWKSQHRKEFIVKAQDIRVLRVKRTEETDDELA